MSKLDSINHQGLKVAVIEMQSSTKYNYYGHFALFFDFVEEATLPAAAGVTIKDRRLKFYYNPKLIDECVEELGEDFLKFLVVHEVSHILLSHVTRTGEREHQLANIAQDMIINTAIATDLNMRFPKFYYVDQDYEYPKYEHKKYDGKIMFEPLYDYLWEENEKNGNDGDSDEDSDDEGQGQGSGGNSQGNSKGKKGRGQLVDHHGMADDIADGKLSESELAQMEGLVKDIHESLKAQGFSAGNIIEKNFEFKKGRSIVNVFRKVFSKGFIKESTYRKISRRCDGLKGAKKESREINLLLDTSGSLYNELNQYIGQVVGKYSIYLIQCDTRVAWEGQLNCMADWKKVQKAGGGGTVLQPAVDRLIELGKHHTPLFIVTDGYTDNIDLSKYKGSVCFVMTHNSCEPKYHGSKKVKVVSSERME